MTTVSGIIVHQTGSPSAQSTLNSYRTANANGAHFLIAKDGVVYQTASVLRRTNHVGKLRARCLAEHKCSPAEIIQYKKSSDAKIHKIEMTKSVPGRYPSNDDSIGIEIVGMAKLPPGFIVPPNLTKNQKDSIMGEKAIYEPITSSQQLSLQYLLTELQETLRIPTSEIHRHPDISRKNITEAATAKWP